MKKIFSTALVASVIALVPGGAALADPPNTLTNAPRHQHLIVTPTVLVPVGPDVCEDPDLQQAFNQFHYNIHHSELRGIGPIDTLGPQHGAPGLHNDRGAELIADRCG